MSLSINWLLLSDLHLGLDDQSWLWPKVKHDIFKDCAKMADIIGAWDVVFFAGDFVQAGKQTEFDRASFELESFWKELSKSGSTPLLCPVPGNHDLIRPEKNAAIARTLTQLWWSDEDLRNTFWREANCEGRKAVEEYFRNYTTWLSNLPVPIVKHNTGILPGDFSSVFTKHEIELGIIGLNSSFLQLSHGDYRGKLDLHISQLNAVCNGDPSAWVKDRSACILLTHQPPSWLSPKALEHYRQEIYPPGRFLSHLFGHQHEPETFETSEAGGAPRRFRQGPSLFGLEAWSGSDSVKRTHGYIAGQFVFDVTNSVERFYPRVAMQARHGGMRLCPDHSFQLRDDNSIVVPFDMDTDYEDPSKDGLSIHKQKVLDIDSTSSDAPPSPELHPLDRTPDIETSKSNLSPCPRLPLGAAAHHRAVRQEEQSLFELEVRKTRSVWLAADWGTGKEGFLAAALERFRDPSRELEVFHLLCGDAVDENSFIALFPQQYGMSMQAFCGYAAALTGAFIVFDDIHPELCTGQNLHILKRIASAIIDFCPGLSAIFISRTPPDNGYFPLVELKPLDIPDVRTYIMHHPDATTSLRDTDVIEKLHERSDGLPMHLDRMLRSLKVSSLESVLDAEMELPSTIESIAATVPKALVHAVTSLAKSNDKLSRRSLRLLKVLSVLPYGETLDVLSHYLQTEPFFIENALQLKELALLDAIPLKHSSPCVGFGKRGLSDERDPKILKVPRQIGLYVKTLLTDEERSEIVLSGVERFFGRRWRDGKVKLRTMPCEYREYLSTGAGNEFAVVHHLIVDAKIKGDSTTTRKAAKLGVQYCRRLDKEGRYRDLLVVAGGLLQPIARDDMPEQWSELAALYGEALRMTGKHTDALNYLHGAIEAGEQYLGNDQKASVWLDVALVEEKLKHTDLAVKAATEIKRLAKPQSATYLHAMAIEAGMTLEGSARNTRLMELEKQARDEGFPSLADTIALDIAIYLDEPPAKIKLLDRVLANKKSAYNQARAVVAKAGVIERNPSHNIDLSNTDRISLSVAYSYLYSQRFGPLFDKCHDTLWNLLESQGDTTQLLRMFRHSSFVWRIRGDENKELEYLNRLKKCMPSSDSPTSMNHLLEVRYYLGRLRYIVKVIMDKEPEKGPNL